MLPSFRLNKKGHQAGCFPPLMAFRFRTSQALVGAGYDDQIGNNKFDDDKAAPGSKVAAFCHHLVRV